MNCDKCGIETSRKTRGFCKKCYNAYYKDKHKERLCSPEAKLILKKYNKERYLLKKDERAEYSKEYYRLNKDKKIKYIRDYERRNYEKVKERHNKWVKKNFVRLALYKKEWRKNNADKIKLSRIKERAHPLFLIKKMIASALRKSFKAAKIKKDSPTLVFLGMTTIELRDKRDSYMGKPCVCGIKCNKQTILNLKNSQCDHIIPLSLCKTKEDVYKLNQLENLRWICDKCNNAKRDRILEEEIQQ